MSVSQPALPRAAGGVQKGPDEDGLAHAPDVSTAGPLDQQHVLERFVDTHLYTHNQPSAQLGLIFVSFFSLCLDNIVQELLSVKASTVPNGYFILTVEQILTYCSENILLSGILVSICHNLTKKQTFVSRLTVYVMCFC